MGILGQEHGTRSGASTADDIMQQDQSSQASGGTGIGYTVMRKEGKMWSRHLCPMLTGLEASNGGRRVREVCKRRDSSD